MSDLWTFRGVVMLTDEVEPLIGLDLIKGLGILSVKGNDWQAPRRPGRVQRPRYSDHRIIPVEGRIIGAGSWANWQTATDTVMDVMDRSLDPGEVIVYPPYLGLTDPVSIMARCTSQLPGDIQNGSPLQRWSFELEAIGSPPDWEPYESS